MVALLTLKEVTVRDGRSGKISDGNSGVRENAPVGERSRLAVTKSGPEGAEYVSPGYKSGEEVENEQAP